MLGRDKVFGHNFFIKSTIRSASLSALFSGAFIADELRVSGLVVDS